MNWRMKALLQQVFSHVPAGERMNLLMQTRVTRSLPAGPRRFDEMWTAASSHLLAVERAFGHSNVSQLTGFEFGAGWHLGVAIALGGLGVGEQVLVDRSPLAAQDLVWHTIRTFAGRQPDNHRLAMAAEAAELEQALSALGISYRAPIDARATGFPPESFDFVSSTSTLEHIPKDELDDLLRECHRLLRPEGVFSALIDYSDHYASFDRSIGSLNFLRFSERRWRVYSPPMQFQNRLRHSDFMERISAAGFRLESAQVVPGTDEDRRWLASTKLDPCFDRYDAEDLLIRDSHVVFRRR